jgi:nucleotide-binding universal stress UspA family protein
MKRILVPTDFSACAENAIAFAVQSAHYLPVEITLLHVVEETGNMYTDYIGVSRDFNQSLMDEFTHALFLLEQKIKETDGIAVRTSIFRGTVTAGILQATEEKNIDLVIMGTWGSGGLKEKIWGNKSASLVQKTSIPVMLIPFHYQWKKPQRFLLATNHFEKAPAILDYLFEMANLYMARVSVAVFTDEDDDGAGVFLEHTRNAVQYEQVLRAQYHDEGLTATHLFGKEFEETLQRFIAENDMDILVMITYARNDFWDRLFHPSAAKRMSYHTQIPLLVIPAKIAYPV